MLEVSGRKEGEYGRKLSLHQKTKRGKKTLKISGTLLSYSKFEFYKSEHEQRKRFRLYFDKTAQDNFLYRQLCAYRIALILSL